MNREDIYNIVVPIAIAIIGSLGTYFFHNINETNFICNETIPKSWMKVI